jgi:hypothetical protein
MLSVHVRRVSEITMDIGPIIVRTLLWTPANYEELRQAPLSPNRSRSRFRKTYRISVHLYTGVGKVIAHLSDGKPSEELVA